MIRRYCRKYAALPFLLVLLLVAACGPSGGFHHDYASGHYASDITQCALYARDASGVDLYGDAGSWWYKAAGRYRRGHVPEKGSVLVLKGSSRMPHGHVAVVKNVVDRRSIDVTHSNWGHSSKSRHIIYDSMRVLDISPNNDWTSVRLWNDEQNVFGFPYAAYGFIYPN
ncbi:MAG TPA: CHAP domain-containing protein [Rickettsiales bacterium]|nr:CHAP domain-containing protein [Rickettsiales bacterium]